MSFKFNCGEKLFWAKEQKSITEVYFLEHKGLSEKIADMPGKFESSEDLIAAILATQNLDRAHSLVKNKN